MLIARTMKKKASNAKHCAVYRNIDAIKRTAPSAVEPLDELMQVLVYSALQ
jgi:hypothetical protein